MTDLDPLALRLREVGLRLVYLHEVGFDEHNPSVPGTFTAQVVESTKGKRHGRGAWGDGALPSAAIAAAIEAYLHPPEPVKRERLSLSLDITLEDLDL